MTTQSAIEIMRATEAKSSAFGHAMALISYDGATTAPSGAGKARGETMGLLSGESYKLTTAPEYREALNYLRDHAAELDRQTAREAELLLRDAEQTSKVPLDEYMAYQKLLSDADYVWHQAKDKSDFPMFEPYLEKVVETMRRLAGYYAPGANPYAFYLDRYEEGLTRETADRFFDTLKAELTPLIHAVNAAEQPDDSFLLKEYPIEKQRLFTEYLKDIVALDRRYISTSETEHPFTTHFSKYDVRYSTHYYESHPEYSMFTVIHESGHAQYELNTADALYRTRLARGASTALHESQSRFFENMIGRTPEFCALVFPKLQELFPEQLAGVTDEMFYKAVNKSFPSLVRTKADELTYSMHVLIRYEIEKQLFDGQLKAHDVPAVWDEMYQKYLGISVPDDRSGCLQDMHWSSGMFGYFPGYSLGSAYAAQMYAKMLEDIDVPATVRAGDLKPVVKWLTERIYRYGAMLKPDEVFLSACGAPFDPMYYVRYLQDKYTKLYNL